MLNNKGFSNFLIIFLVLVLLGVGGYFGYSYYKSSKEDIGNKIISQNNLTTIRFVMKERSEKCEDIDILITYYDIELNKNNEKKIIGELSVNDKVYIYKNKVFYTSENLSNKTFSIFSIDSNLNPAKLKEYKFDGINNSSGIFIDESLIFILNKDKLSKLDLVKLTEQTVNLSDTFDLSNQVKGREFAIKESRKKSKCDEAFGGIPSLYQIRNVDDLRITMTIQNALVPSPETDYLNTFKYQMDESLENKVITFENGIFK